MSEVNVPLLRKAVEWVEEQAAQPLASCRWNQGRWVTSSLDRAHKIALSQGWETFTNEKYEQKTQELAAECGTAYCVAGYIGQMLEPRYAQSENVDGVHVSVFAAEALGIPIRDINFGVADSDLFAGGNSAEDVRRIAEKYAGEKL